MDVSEVLPDKLYLSGVFQVCEENLRKMEISFVVRGEREGFGIADDALLYWLAQHKIVEHCTTCEGAVAFY